MSSSQEYYLQGIPEQDGFQSRNRGAFDFKVGKRGKITNSRTSFNLVIEVLLISSLTYLKMVAQPATCFNLVIEILLISSQDAPYGTVRDYMFQSRNRDSFDFK